GAQGSSTIKFNGTTATPTSWTSTRIVVSVPAGATTGNVVVHTSGIDTNGVAFAVSTLTSIAMTPANPSVPLHSQQRFWAIGTYANGATADLGANASWTSSDTTVAPVDVTGLISGDTQGTATIQATRGGVNASQTITITGSVFRFAGNLNVRRSGHTATKLQ